METIKIVRGNDVNLYVPMVQKNADGTMTAIAVAQLTDLVVKLTKDGAEYTDFTTAVTANSVVVQLTENTPCGNYKMEITAKEQGVNIAYRLFRAFDIVEFNEESSFLDYVRGDGVTLAPAMFVGQNDPVTPATSLQGVTVNGTDLQIQNNKAVLSLTLLQKSTPNTGYSATYQLLVEGEPTGDDINIPNGGGITGGTTAIVTPADKAAGGKFENDPNFNIGDPYLDLDATGGHVYVNLNGVIKTYTAGSGLTLNGAEFSVDTNTIQVKLTAGANITIQGNEISATVPTKTSELQNDSGFLTSESDPVFSASPAAGITAQDISDWNAKSDFSGSYDDLTHKPTIPTKTSQLQNDGADNTSTYVEHDELANVATSGNYNDLNGKPTIPSTANCYETTDPNENDIDDADKVPFYDTSATGKRSTLWSNIKSKLKAYFDNYYITSHQDISGKADKVSGATSGDLAGLDSNGNLTDSGITATSVSGAVADAHTHSNKTLLDMLPSTLGTAGQVPTVNSGATGIEWQTPSGGSATDVQINSTSITSGGVANIVTETAYNASTNKIATYKDVHPTTGSSQPAGGMLPNTLYKLGTLSGSVSISLASPSDNTICNHYYFTFDADSTAPTITWDAAITSWNGGSAPTITASKHYEISVLDGVATYMEV